MALATPDALQLSPLSPGGKAVEDLSPGMLASLIMQAPPGTAERRYALGHALRALAVGGRFVVSAPKDKGGLRLKRELMAFGCEVAETSKAHKRLCSGVRPAELLGLDDAISAGALQLVPSLQLWSQPGLFSWNRIDPGSALLAEALPNLSGEGADFGCGFGFLALQALRSEALKRLHLLDVDGRAISAARRNISDPRAAFHWADLRAGAEGLGVLDFVIMNPPFHDGGAEDQSLGQAFIRQAAKVLRKGGTCWLVANRHLPYEGVLTPLFVRVTLVLEQGGYKIYEARR
jgi:16S rRNA (guanine1207-N2)-methyltransferase